MMQQSYVENQPSRATVNGLKVGNYKIGPEILALQWSFSQKCYHVQPFVDYISSNLERYFLNRPSDFMLIGIFSSYDQIEVFKASLKRLDVYQYKKVS